MNLTSSFGPRGEKHRKRNETLRGKKDPRPFPVRQSVSPRPPIPAASRGPDSTFPCLETTGESAPKSGGASPPLPASRGIPVSNNKDASRSPPPPAAARPARAAAPGLAPPPQARPQCPSPSRPHAPAPEGPQPRCPAERAGREPPPPRCPPLGAIRGAAAAGLSRPAAGPGRGGGTRAAVPGDGTKKDGSARKGPLALPTLASSRRRCSSTRARVLLTNDPGARRWSCCCRRRRRLFSGLRSRVAVIAAAAAAATTTSTTTTALSGTADTTQTQPGVSSLRSSFLAPFQPTSRWARPRGGREAGREPRGTRSRLAKAGVGH